MALNILVGCILMILCIFIHALATRYTMILAIKYGAKMHAKVYLKQVWVSVIVLVMFGASLIESLIWAGTFIFMGALENFEEAFYFSMVTFTTLGYGDVTLTDSYRLLASMEAANGIIIFGWSTAIIMAAVQRFYFKSSK